MNKRGYKYFSQNGEDFLLWNFFKYKERGFFVDVGAFDGVHLSNSYSFEQKGWSGVCIEPNQQYFEMCKQSRPGSVCLNVACVEKENIEKVTFYVEPSGLYSGTAPGREDDIAKSYQHGWSMEFPGMKKVLVSASTLNAVLTENKPPDAGIDFISIDVEGTELDVLRGLDLSRFGPRVLLIESNTEKDRIAVGKYLEDFGYISARELKINTFYTRNRQDAREIQNIELKYQSEKNIHPLGEQYTLKQFKEAAMRNEVAIYLEELKQRNKWLEECHENLEKYKERLRKNKEQQALYVRRMEDQKEKIEGMEAELKKILESQSWRMTAPLRKIKLIVKGLINQ